MFSLQFLIVGDNEPPLSNNAGGATNDPKLDDNGIIYLYKIPAPFIHPCILYSEVKEV